jgi:chemotaxis protein MotB
MESLRVEHDDLSEDVAQLEKTRDLLSTHLREREAEVAELSKRSGEYEGLVKELEQEVSSGQIQITQLREGLRLNLAQDILFRSGSATLEPYGVDLLNKVSEQLAKFPQEVEVQGHTDNVPVSKSSRWGTNWELAAARAASVVRLFEKQGIDATHLRAVSYGQHAPVDTNDTAEGRARNRRIDIRLKPIDAPEEAAAADQATSSSAAEAQPAPAP